MKNYNRAYNRYMKHVKFVKRLNKWITGNVHTSWEKGKGIVYKKRVDVIEDAFKGECYTFLRTTGRPCNCYMCSTYEKYKREQNQYVKKRIDKDMEP